MNYLSMSFWAEILLRDGAIFSKAHKMIKKFWGQLSVKEAKLYAFIYDIYKLNVLFDTIYSR